MVRWAMGVLAAGALLLAGCHEASDASAPEPLAAPAVEWSIPFRPAAEITSGNEAVVELTKVLINLTRAGTGEEGYRFMQQYSDFRPSRAAWEELRQRWLRVAEPPVVRLAASRPLPAGGREVTTEVVSTDPAVNGMVWVYRSDAQGDLRLHDIRLPGP